MLHDNISFQITDLKLLSRIFQRYVRMLTPMQRVAGVGGLALSPVIEEEVMQKAASSGRAVVESQCLGYRVRYV